jgi:predicted dehydrogenase
MADRQARIGVIGAGWWATYAHLPALTSYSRAQVVAIADPTPERLAQAAEAFGVERTYADYHAMLDREQLDGVVVATPHATHAAIAYHVLDRGLALMLEKPMVLRADEARHLRDLATARGVPLVIGYPYHFIPQHQALRRLIADGALGSLQLVDTLFASMVLEYYRANPLAYAQAFSWKVTGPLPTTYSEPSIAGGGQGHLQMTHSVALLLWLTDLRPREVMAFMENFDVRVDLVDALSVRFEGGTLGSLASTGAIDARQSGNQQLEYRLYGSEGYALLDAMAGTCTLYRNDGSVEALPVTPSDQLYPKERTSRHLVDILLDGVPNQSPAEIGVRTVELLEAAYRSAAERRLVRIDEL